MSDNRHTPLTYEYLDEYVGIEKHHGSSTYPTSSDPEKKHYDYDLPCNFQLSGKPSGFSLSTWYLTEHSSDSEHHFTITTVEEFKELMAFLKKFDK